MGGGGVIKIDKKKCRLLMLGESTSKWPSSIPRMAKNKLYYLDLSSLSVYVCKVLSGFGLKLGFTFTITVPSAYGGALQAKVEKDNDDF